MELFDLRVKGQRTTSVAHIAVLVPDDPQEVEAESQESSPQQVAQRC